MKEIDVTQEDTYMALLIEAEMLDKRKNGPHTLALKEQLQRQTKNIVTR